MTTHRNPSRRIGTRAKDAYWRVVEDCLVEIHQRSRPDAQQLCLDLRRKIDRPPPGIDSDIFYHSEPFDVACNLAGQSLDHDQHRSDYDAILKRHNW